MQDDFNDLEDMIFNNASLVEIATDLSKNIEVSDYVLQNFDEDENVGIQ